MWDSSVARSFREAKRLVLRTSKEDLRICVAECWHSGNSRAELQRMITVRCKESAERHMRNLNRNPFLLSMLVPGGIYNTRS